MTAPYRFYDISSVHHNNIKTTKSGVKNQTNNNYNKYNISKDTYIEITNKTNRRKN